MCLNRVLPLQHRPDMQVSEDYYTHPSADTAAVFEDAVGAALAAFADMADAPEGLADSPAASAD